MMRTPLIVGNWKMNKTLADARELIKGIHDGIKGVTGVDTLICPPVQLLFPVAKAVADSPIMMGAQDAHEEQFGAYTGEVSVAMLKDTGCTHVIIGHSERRQLYGEDAPLLARKVRAVVNGGLTVIYCLGETLEEREGGHTVQVVERQMNEVINRDVNPERVVIAYEPIWAIGTGRTATPQQAAEVHARIRSLLAMTYSPEVGETARILYGGSVKPENAGELLRQEDIDGALVGGACLEISSFLGIISAAGAVGAMSN